MILNVRLNNFLVYSNEVELSARADMRIKKFNNNVFNIANFNILKSICIYGPNNSGKTCLIRGIGSIKNVLLGNTAEVPSNLYSNNQICSFGISFIENNKAYCYDFKYDSTEDKNTKTKKGFVFESLKELSVDKYGNMCETDIFIRDTINNVYKFAEDLSLNDVLSIVSSNNILIYTINTDKYKVIEKYKNILRSFAAKIQIVDMNNIPIENTIDVLKKQNEIAPKVVDLIKMADLHIDDFNYNKGQIKSNIKIVHDGFNKPQEAVFNASNLLEDMFRLTSVHKGIPVPSLIYDSTGTKKIIAAASYIIDCLINGKILIIDELDSSLHFKITRAIVALFNNDSNISSQLIFTAHDITLLDCKKLFRKDQIWFASKDSQNEYLYSLSEFNSSQDHVRSESDIISLYSKGVFGAIPEPDLIQILLNISSNGSK